MALIDPMLLNMDSNMENFNGIRDIVIARLVDDKLITQEQGEEYSTKWQIIIIKPNWFTRWREKFTSSKNDEYIVKFVRLED